MTTDQMQALALLQSHPQKWVRPGNKARLLAYLMLALHGLAVAADDESGLRFQLAPQHEVAA
jgi:hypothetical protein